MRIVLSIVVALLISIALPAQSAYAYGGGASGGLSNPEGDTSAPISFTGSGSFQPGFHSNVTLSEFKGPLKFDHSIDREINFWFGMMMWTEIFDQGMGLVTFLPSLIKVPVGIAYQGPKNVVRLMIYGEERTMKLNVGLQSSPETRNISGWFANTFVLKPIRWVRKKVSGK